MLLYTLYTLKFCHFQSLVERRDIQLSGLLDVYQARRWAAMGLRSVLVVTLRSDLREF